MPLLIVPSRSKFKLKILALSIDLTKPPEESSMLDLETTYRDSFKRHSPVHMTFNVLFYSKFTKNVNLMHGL